MLNQGFHKKQKGIFFLSQKSIFVFKSKLMKAFSLVILFLFVLIAPAISAKVVVIDHPMYQLHKIRKNQNGLLILFPGFGGSPDRIAKSFEIMSYAEKEKFSVVFMKMNSELFTTDDEHQQLTAAMLEMSSKHHVNLDNVVIGGFSAGGMVTTLWSNYLLETDRGFKPEKVFVVDAPLDMRVLYNKAVNYGEDAHENTKAEGEYIKNYCARNLNELEHLEEKIAAVSPIDYKTQSTQNIDNLERIQFRVYTEPDANWWKENRGFDYEMTNSFILIRFVEQAQEGGWDKLELIKTENKGYRPDGSRHPHSWSIVDPKELMIWITK